MDDYDFYDFGYRIWSSQEVSSRTYDGESRRDLQHAIFEQYKLYVQASDRLDWKIRATDGFFLTLNLTVLLFLVFTVVHPGVGTTIGLWVVLAVECSIWSLSMSSMLRLQKSKHQVIAALEERLPAAPFSKGERGSMRYSRSFTRTYTRLSTLILPWIFSAVFFLELLLNI